MKITPPPSSKEIRKRQFDEARSAVSAEVDSVIASIDAASSPEAVQQAERVIERGAARVKEFAESRISGDLQQALSDAATSAATIRRLAISKAGAETTLSRLSHVGGVQFGFALLYLFAAGAAFLTELKLTESFVDLLGYRRDDPAGRAICASFAASLLVFELIFLRLRLLDDPWAFFRHANSDDGGAPRRRWRVLAAVMLLIVSGAIAGLQALTVVKLAPTRTIAGAVQLAHRDMTQAEAVVVDTAALFLSICVLISGGYLAAAGSREISAWGDRRKLAKAVERADRRSATVSTHLDTIEKPALAAALQQCGLPFLWLTSADPAGFSERLEQELKPGAMAIEERIRLAASVEGAMFDAAKRTALLKARARPTQSTNRARQSWRDEVDEALRQAA